MPLHTYEQMQQKKLQYRINCEACSGLCCVALYFSHMDGFPNDKLPGIPCCHLASDFRCQIHASLSKKHLSGCIAYDCNGAGQVVTALYSEQNWRQNPQLASEIYEQFIKATYLKQMLWYLDEILTLLPAKQLWQSIPEYQIMIQTILSSKTSLQACDIDTIGNHIHPILEKAGILVANCFHQNLPSRQKHWIGYDFKQQCLDGVSFHNHTLIAAKLNGCHLAGVNFLGADVRDVHIEYADCSDAIFLTQMQLNVMIGNEHTLIPAHLQRPHTWK